MCTAFAQGRSGAEQRPKGRRGVECGRPALSRRHAGATIVPRLRLRLRGRKGGRRAEGSEVVKWKLSSSEHKHEHLQTAEATAAAARSLGEHCRK